MPTSTSVPVALDRRIRVEVKNDFLGHDVFWEGPASAIAQIRNIPARRAAVAVVADGKTRVVGMWHVSVMQP